MFFRTRRASLRALPCDNNPRYDVTISSSSVSLNRRIILRFVAVRSTRFSEKWSDISLYFEQRCFVVRKKYKIIGIPYVVLYFELMLHELVEFVHVDIDQ